MPGLGVHSLIHLGMIEGIFAGKPNIFMENERSEEAGRVVHLIFFTRSRDRKGETFSEKR